MIKFAFLQCCR